MANEWSKQVFSANLRKYIERSGKSQRELADIIGVSAPTFNEWVTAKKFPRIDKIQKLADYFGILKSDLIEEKPAQPAPAIPGIQQPTFHTVPLLGSIACGEPILAQENLDGFASVDGGVQCDFALLCKGDSMAPRLMDGDLVFIRQQPTVENGQIAAVLIGSDATLKHVYVTPAGIQLVAENPDYAPIVLIGEDAHTARILGKAVAYRRNI